MTPFDISVLIMLRGALPLGAPPQIAVVCSHLYRAYASLLTATSQGRGCISQLSHRGRYHGASYFQAMSSKHREQQLVHFIGNPEKKVLLPKYIV